MVSSVFFNNFTNSPEQQLVEDLIAEMIRIYGADCYYLPRTVVNLDAVLNEPETTRFDDALLVELYIKNFDSFEGDGKFLSKFGLEVRDQMTFTVSVRAFEQDVKQYSPITRPREGDLVFLPMTKGVYQVKYVDKSAIFYQMGSIQCYDLVCELFEYSNEQFNTGIADIDGLFKPLNSTEVEELIATEDQKIILTEDDKPLQLEQENEDLPGPFDDNQTFENEGDEILDFTETDPFSEGGRY